MVYSLKLLAYLACRRLWLSAMVGRVYRVGDSLSAAVSRRCCRICSWLVAPELRVPVSEAGAAVWQGLTTWRDGTGW